ncbi:hypothetical protein [Mediterraneibacter gnavus]|uniref:hypothetical protein n=1 Tax=Mediterraneibacter gnavus TaxID=33038 RepID=UPI003569D65A
MSEFVKKKAVVVTDETGLPNFMTMFYMEPGSCPPEEVPDMFRVNEKTVAAVLISQFTNTVIKGIAASLPYQKPAKSMTHDESVEACRKKGKGWHMLTNAEFVYLLDEADRLGHKISGNTNYGKNADNQEEKGWCYDGYTTLTGLDPLAWSHDGTKDGVFGLCGNFHERVAGLRLHYGVIEYIKDNDAAFADGTPGDPRWTAAELDGKGLKLEGRNGGVVLTDGDINRKWDGCHMRELQLTGSLEEVPEIIYKLGILPRDWKERKDGIWADASLEEAVPLRGSSFGGTSYGGPAALGLNYPRSGSYSYVSFRSALYLEDWELVTEILGAGAEAHAVK